MAVYLCKGIHGGGAADRAEGVGDIWDKSPLLLWIAVWIGLVVFEEGNEPADFAVENVSDRNAPGWRGWRARAVVRHRAARIEAQT